MTQRTVRLRSAAELTRVFDDERPGLRPAPREEAIGFLAVVEHDEQSSACGAQPPKSRIGGPYPRLIAVLRERLNEQARRKEVREPGAHELALESPLNESDVVVVHEQRRRQRRAISIREGDVAAIARSVIERTEVASELEPERLPRVRLPIEAKLGVVVLADRQRDVR